MIEDDRPTRPESADSVLDMLEDYRRRHEALQTQTRELADLQREVLQAAVRESTAIVADARAKIARVVADARRELLNLTRRLEGVPDSAGQVASVQQARREIARLVDEAEAGIGTLRKDARKLDAAAAPEVEPARDISTDGRPSPIPPRREEPPARPEPTFELPARPLPTFELPTRPTPTFELPTRPRRRLPRGWIVGVVIAVVAIAAAVLWWIRRSGPREQPTVGSIRAPDAVARGSTPAPATVPAASAPAAAHALTLVIQARRPVWVRKTIDGYAEGGQLMTSGERSQIVADREVAIRAGDAGAVMVSVNGSPAEPLGTDGAVVTRRFEAAGRPASDRAPSRSATPTPSAQATAATAGVDRNSSNAEPAQSPAVPPTSRGSPPAPPKPPAARESNARDSSASAPELTTAAQRWLDAYYRQDVPAMQAIAMRDMKVSDQRTPAERLPPSAESVRRTLEGMSFQFVGETAIMTARMIEQGTVGGRTPQSISWISLMWIREGGQWRLMDVQILSDAKMRVR